MLNVIWMCFFLCRIGQERLFCRPPILLTIKRSHAGSCDTWRICCYTAGNVTCVHICFSLFYMAVGLSYGECSFVECNPDLSSSLVSLLPQRRHPLLNPRPWRGDQRKPLLCLCYVSGDLGGGNYA